MVDETWLLILVLVSGFYMSWSIGANDVANAMGTSVGSGALSLRRAVIIAAILEFSGALFFGSYVAETMQSGIVNPVIFDDKPLILVYGMLASLIAAGAWLQLASYYGWPVSTTHTIVGAIVGFGIISGGLEAIYWGNLAYIFTSWVFSPLVGGVISFLIFTLLRRQIFYRSNPVEAAKKLTPVIVFFVLSILSLIFLFHGLKNIGLHLSLQEALLASISMGLVGSAISYFLMKRIENVPGHLRANPYYNADVLAGLQKARKHLQRVQTSSSGELHYQVSSILGEVENLTHSIQPVENVEDTHSEYAQVEKIFGYLQIMSACLMAFAHGANDVANAIGPLSACIAILTSGIVALSSPIPPWGLALGGAGIVVGLATWGWRVIETIGKRITELTPTRGFAAEFGAATTIVFATRLGLPISTTHTLVGSVIGVGLARGIGALNMSTTRDIILSWIITIPAGASLSVIFFYAIRALFS